MYTYYRSKIASSPEDEKEYKLALGRLRAAQKANKAVPAAEANRLVAVTSKLSSDLYAQFQAASRAKQTPDDYYTPVDEKVVDTLRHLHGEVSQALNGLSGVSLRKGDMVHRDILEAVKKLPRMNLKPDYLAEACGLADVIRSAAYYVRAKAERAQDLVQYYQGWAEFYQAKDRAPSYQEQMAFEPKSAGSKNALDLPSEEKGGKPSYDDDFKAGFKAGKAAYDKDSDIDSSTAERAYKRVSNKHGNWWVDGFSAAIDLARGADNTKPAQIARKLKLSALADPWKA